MQTNVTIHSARLVLRIVSIDDGENVSRSWNLGDGNISLEEALAKIERMQANHALNRPGHVVHLCLAVVEKASQEIIGWCGLDHLDRTREYPVLFYLLNKSCWGKGLATEATRALLDYAFGELNVSRIDGAAAPDNLASIRVMEKAGMRHSGLDQDGSVLFTISKDEYSQAR